jgi:nuclease-like protein
MARRDDKHEANGSAGASARREYERRKAGREQRAREAHPRIGGLLLWLNGTPQHVERWERGAEGEELVANALAARCNGHVLLLHDRRLPGTRANVDHIAIAPSGVWVIDTKRYKGKVEVTNHLFSAPALRIGGRDRTKLVAGLSAQVDAVKQAVETIDPAVRVHGCFCFVDAELPLLRTPTINGFRCLSRKGLAKELNARGPLVRDRASLLAQGLATRFPAA